MHNLSIQGLRQVDQIFKVIPDDVASSRPGWFMGDSVSKHKLGWPEKQLSS